ncbi:MAG TPA: DUF1338 domain-containing protein [Elusimicrobiota bacterium]|jgi:hypothetical protein|nr:DUF1338 domain-containing protein [Elusimicrobiota bacterium]
MKTPAEFAQVLLDELWAGYRARVPYVGVYERLVRGARTAFVNDHVAFRTFAGQGPAGGIASVARVFEALGFVAEACYAFPDKKLSAVHLRHRDPALPKAFVSELRTWELPPPARRVVQRALKLARPALSDEDLAGLARPAALSAPARARLLRRAVAHFSRPWPAPAKADVLALDRESQYAAWTLLHGRTVNHFTASVDSHGPGPLSDIEKTVAALRAAGVPMKGEIEGKRGSKLRQSATAAAEYPAEIRDRGRRARLPWTYAYFELAERGFVKDPETGARKRFEGFLGGQASQLFEMTKRAGARR